MAAQNALVSEHIACTHGAGAVGKLNLAKGPQALGAVRAGERAGLDVAGCDDAVARADIGEIVLEEVVDLGSYEQLTRR
jgi:hypothetical protein